MSNKLNLETALKMVPDFNGSNTDKLFSFLNCKFVKNNIDRSISSIILEGKITKLKG